MISYQYDALGCETSETWDDGHSFSYAYDALGNMLSAADNDSTDGSADSFVYNPLGQVTSETQAIDGLTRAVTLGRQYDAVGNLTDLRAAIGTTADIANHYTYDAVGQMIQVEQYGAGGNAVAAKRVDFNYNADGQFLTIDRYNNLDSNPTHEVASSAYGYDAAGRLTSLDHTQGTTSLAGYAYTYDAGNNMTQMKSSADATTGNAWGVADYTYDNSNQLQTATYTTWASPPANENYGYDANGNRNTGGNTVQSTGDNRMATDAAGNTYTYDAEGNMLTKTDAGGNETNDTWDYRDRLVEMKSYSGSAASGTLTKTVGYVYDAFNRLVKETVTTPAAGGGNTVAEEAFAYDGTNMVLQFQKTGTTVSNLGGTNLSDRYLWGPAVDQILADEKVQATIGTPGRILWGLSDNEGTIRDIVDNTGALVDHRVFNSFGKMTSESAAAFAFGYDGTFFDADLAMNRMGARLYAPDDGRFASQDPLGLLPDSNPYRYCGNTPTTYVDPTGLDWLDAAANWAAGWGDTITGGATNGLRNVLGINDGIDHNSGAYHAGVVTGQINNAANVVVGGVGAVKAVGGIVGSVGVGVSGVNGGAAVVGITVDGAAALEGAGALVQSGSLAATGVLAMRAGPGDGGAAGGNAPPRGVPGQDLPGEGSGWTKLKGNQGWKDAQGNTWKKDMLHKDHWDVTCRHSGKKIREVDFDGNELWPNGPKNKGKSL